MGLVISYRAREAEAAGPLYAVTLRNQSTLSWIFYLYQKMPGQSSGFFSLAWFASPFVITVGNWIRFEWQTNYNFVWGATGKLVPGVTFSAGGEIDADPIVANTTTFSAQPGPNLSAAVQAPPAGSLVIRDANDVPQDTFAVGIGMSGAGTYAVQASPNLAHQITPVPSYWVAAAANMKVGTALDIQTITLTVEVEFPVNVFSKTLTLNADNTWV
jgi:rhizosphere induced protein